MKYVCTICGYVHEGDAPPDKCPQCGAPAEKFEEQATGELVWHFLEARLHATLPISFSWMVAVPRETMFACWIMS